MVEAFKRVGRISVVAMDLLHALLVDKAYRVHLLRVPSLDLPTAPLALCPLDLPHLKADILLGRFECLSPHPILMKHGLFCRSDGLLSEPFHQCFVLVVFPGTE
jgi:hypothetical protein